MSFSRARGFGSGRLSTGRAVLPNLSYVILDPALVFTLILANLMSPRL
jgi:hypothetical protein